MLIVVSANCEKITALAGSVTTTRPGVKLTSQYVANLLSVSAVVHRRLLKFMFVIRGVRIVKKSGAVPHQSAACTGRQITPRVGLGTYRNYCRSRLISPTRSRDGRSHRKRRVARTGNLPNGSLISCGSSRTCFAHRDSWREHADNRNNRSKRSETLPIRPISKRENEPQFNGSDHHVGDGR